MVDSKTKLLEEVRRGWKRIEHKIPADQRNVYVDRTKHELSVIHKLGFDGYFLIVFDFVKWARDHNIRVGAGRGSAAGSLVSYLLDITRMDPIKHGLLFERFLNEDRVSLPDIDLDFMDTRREEVVQYIRTKYGEDRVAFVITYSKILGRGVIRDVGRILEIPLLEINEMCDSVDYEGDLEFSMADSRKLQPWMQRYPELFEVALKLSGQLKTTSQHAAGVVISPKPMSEMLPVYLGKNGVTTQWDKNDLEYLGFAKFDLLSLKTLTIIQEALDAIGELDVDIDDLPLNDPVILEMFKSGHTMGLFQFETWLNRKLLKEVGPQNFIELTACVALGRPGAKDGLEYYIAGKEGGEINCLHPSLTDVLTETYGCLIYQEQSMKIAQILAGFSLQQADVLRRAIGKSIAGGVEKLWNSWVEGTRKKGVDDNTSKEVFDIIKQSEKYSFNKSHASVYAYVAWQTAFLKAHYPREYMAALMSNTPDEKKLADYMKETRRMGIEILPTSVNLSGQGFKKEGSAIRMGFSCIKGVGGTAPNEIVAKKPYTSFQDFLEKISRSLVKRNVITSLIDAGAFDEFQQTKEEMKDFLETGGKPKADMSAQSLFGEDSSFEI